jgi:uncharacterized protein YnzC (UPF0291/DUF896 family)
MPITLVETREWDRPVPEDWERKLREYSPISTTVPWLATRWWRLNNSFVGRWLISECVHESLVSEGDQDILTVLNGPRPSTLPDGFRQAVESFCNDYQWEMYRKHKVWARELWIVQGDRGGHATAFSQEERRLLQLMGLPTDPPAVGALDYAPLDERVLRRLQERNRLHKVKNDLAALRKQGSLAAITAEEEAHEKAFRRRYLDFLSAQSASRAELLTYLSGKSEMRDTIPQATAAELNAASRLRDEYIDTGIIPSA